MPSNNKIPLPSPHERRSLFETSAREAHAYKWIESEKARRDLGDWAIAEWYKKYWRVFCRARFIEHLLGECFWNELDANDFSMINYRFNKDDPLIAIIVEIFRQGGENLDVITYAYQNKLDQKKVITRLQIFDINSRRLAPVVAITEKQFVDNIHANHHPRALVVDNDEQTPRVVGDLSRHKQMECVSLANGEDALKETEARRFDVFFIAVSLPNKKQGAEIAWYLRRHGVLAPIAALSDNFANWSEDDLIDCGFSHWLTKPLERDKVEHILTIAQEKMQTQRG